jgi:hypothetical protein
MLSIPETDRLREELSSRLNATLKSRRIRALDINSAYHWQPPLQIEVGRPCRYLEPDSEDAQEVLAIFESTVFLVVTSGHGVPDGLPYFFSREDVRRVHEMDT